VELSELELRTMDSSVRWLSHYYVLSPVVFVFSSAYVVFDFSSLGVWRLFEIFLNLLVVVASVLNERDSCIDHGWRGRSARSALGLWLV
jgi:hypothetical protein